MHEILEILKTLEMLEIMKSITFLEFGKCLKNRIRLSKGRASSLAALRVLYCHLCITGYTASLSHKSVENQGAVTINLFLTMASNEDLCTKVAKYFA